MPVQLGPFARIIHWGPLTALVIIKGITGMTLYCNSMWWPTNTFGGFLNNVCFMGLSGLTLYNFLSSMSLGPGYLPKNWAPENEADTIYLQFCNVCQSYKAPRSHHCQKCDRCVLKMDHHCPWINNCVGWGNQGHFIAFLSFAVLGCVHATVVLGSSLYRSLFRLHYLRNGLRNVPIVNLGIYGTISSVLCLGFSIGVVIAVGLILIFQLKGVLRNQTAIEDWIVEKANYRRRNTDADFVFPYDLGKLNNLKQVITLTCQPIGDGIHWPLKKGCDQYSLTVEQLAQKAEKRIRTKIYSIIKPVSGSWVPITQGFGVCLHPPCTDEPRIKLDVGDRVLVTRWRKYWLFGEKIQDNSLTEESTRRIRGWFPRKCAVELIENEASYESQDYKKIQ